MKRFFEVTVGGELHLVSLINIAGENKTKTLDRLLDKIKKMMQAGEMSIAEYTFVEVN